MKYIIILIVVLVVLVFVEMYRELHTFQIKEYVLRAPAFSKLKEEKRIIFLSDMHNQVYGNHNKKLMDAVIDAKPDMILIGGDMLVGKNGCSYENALNFVKRLPEVCPVYYACGNHEQRMKEYPEQYHPAYADYREELLKAGVHFLENDTAEVYLDDVAVKITGLEIPSRCYTHFRTIPMEAGEIKERIGECDPEVYHILMAHNPSYVEEYKAWGADLILCGHLHGGMVRLPGIGGVIAPSFALFPKYSGDMYQEGNSTVVVSKGLGTHTINVRLFNPAELVVLRLVG